MVLHSLSKYNLIFTTTKYNKYNTDRTQSYSVNYDRLTQVINNASIYTILDNYNEDKDQLVNSRVPTWLVQSANLVTSDN